jgi:hypothetical protein
MLPSLESRRALASSAVLWWITLTLTTAWLPTIRGVMDGQSYQWATTVFGWSVGGRGMSDAFWFVVLRSAIGIALLYAGWRRPTKRARMLVALYVSELALEILWAAATEPDGFRFRGDTLGVDVSLTWVAPIAACVFAALAVMDIVEPADNSRTNVAWTPAGRRRLVIALAVLPLQWVLLHNGHGMDWRDMVGVGITIAQWWLLSASMASRGAVRTV